MESTKEMQQRGDFGESIGVAQIRLLPGRPSRDWLMSPYNNISYAKQIYDKQGFSPWSCYKKPAVKNPSQLKEF